jgi:hypothetical protein
LIKENFFYAGCTSGQRTVQLRSRALYIQPGTAPGTR